MNRRPIPRVPRLLPEDILDDSRLGGVIDRVITADDKYTKLTGVILDHQGRLQELSEPDAWIAYIDLEAAMNDRMNMTLALVAKWAFEDGRRHQRRR